MPTRKPVPFPPTVALADIEADLRHQIAARAFELYTQRGAEHGHDLDDWLRAEQEVLQNTGAAAVA